MLFGVPGRPPLAVQDVTSRFLLPHPLPPAHTPRGAEGSLIAAAPPPPRSAGGSETATPNRMGRMKIAAARRASRSRTAPTVARRLVRWLLRERAGLSLPPYGRRVLLQYRGGGVGTHKSPAT